MRLIPVGRLSAAQDEVVRSRVPDRRGERPHGSGRGRIGNQGVVDEH